MRKSSALAGLVLTSALVLAACASDDTGGEDTTGADSEDTTGADSEDTAGGEEGDFTCLGDLVDLTGEEPLEAVQGDGGVETTGSFGDKPELVVPDGDPSGELTVEVLVEGDGPELSNCDLVTVDYLGQAWEAGDDSADNVFDNSYDRDDPFRFGLGLRNVIAGWDAGLVGQRVGSRLLLSIPAEHAYGDDAEAHQLGGQTLLFVVDIIDHVAADAGVSGDAVSDLPDDLPTVTGDGAGAPPVVDVTDASPVEESGAVLLVEGDGEDLKEFLVLNLLQVSFTTGEVQFSNWEFGQGPLGGPSDGPLTADVLPGLADALDGQRVGSRVLVRIAPDDNPTEAEPDGEGLAIVVDVVGTY